jgi:hypothetical protein
LTPHKFDTFRHVNQPSPFRSEATLAEALEGSKPIGRTLGTAAGVAGGGGGSLGGGASITAETGEAAEVGGLAKTLSGAGKVMKFGGDVVMGAFVFRRAFLAGYYLRERRGWEAAKQIPLLAKDLILDPILMMADMRQRQIDAIRAMYPNDPYGPDAERMLKYSCLTGGPSCHW